VRRKARWAAALLLLVATGVGCGDATPVEPNASVSVGSFETVNDSPLDVSVDTSSGRLCVNARLVDEPQKVFRGCGENPPVTLVTSLVRGNVKEGDSSSPYFDVVALPAGSNVVGLPGTSLDGWWVTSATEDGTVVAVFSEDPKEATQPLTIDLEIAEAAYQCKSRKDTLLFECTEAA
jgi:hypothetical protein